MMIIENEVVTASSDGYSTIPLPGVAIDAESIDVPDPDPNQVTIIEWKYKAGIWEFEITLHPEDEGGYSVTVPALPGAISEGDTIEQSLGNIREAIAGLIESYQADGEDIPWRAEADQPPPQPGDLVKWVVVHV